MARSRARLRRPQGHLVSLARAACAALALTLGPAAIAETPDEPQTAQISLSDARVLAQRALAGGHTALAIKIANGLLQADPKDPSAHFILASAMAQTGDITAARKAAAKAYRVSDTDAERVAAAQFAARAALGEARPTLTQLWLRRAAVHADDEVSKSRIARDYRRVRQINPFSFRLGVGFRPSSNVNNGADSALQVIDGVPAVGLLSGSAQALAGNIGTFDVDLRYRLGRTKRSETSVGSRVYVRRVWLSSSAQDQAPDLDNEDLGSTYFETNINNTFALGAKGNTVTVGAALGKAWSGGDESYDFTKLRIGRSVRLGDRTRLSLSASVEERTSARHWLFDQKQYQIGTYLNHRLDNGDRIGFSLGFTETEAPHANNEQRSHSFRASYSFGKAVGPAKISTSLTIGQAEFDRFRVGFIKVPDGRRDDSLYGDVTFFFSDWDYAGFAPSIRLRAGRRDSNVSRYESEEFSIDFQIRSTF